MRGLTHEQLRAELDTVLGSPIEKHLLWALARKVVAAKMWAHIWWECPACCDAGRKAGGSGFELGVYCCDKCSGFGTLKYGNVDYEHYVGDAHIWVQPQMGPHRVDFSLGITQFERGCSLDAWSESQELIIECDGHDYHSSKEQRTKDAARDRYLTAEGYRVLRFTGTEIWRDEDACAAEILRVARACTASITAWDESAGRFLEVSAAANGGRH